MDSKEWEAHEFTRAAQPFGKGTSLEFAEKPWGQAVLKGCGFKPHR
jgi:hypothetical protein